MNVVDYRPEHAMSMNLQDKQVAALGRIDRGYAEKLSQGAAYSVMDEGTVLMCCGRMPVWEGRWMVWALVSADAGRHMLRLTRAAKRLLDAQPDGLGRLEFIIRCDFEQAIRWARLLGLEYHHHEERFLPGGADANIYVRHY